MLLGVGAMVYTCYKVITVFFSFLTIEIQSCSLKFLIKLLLTYYTVDLIN